MRHSVKMNYNQCGRFCSTIRFLALIKHCLHFSCCKYQQQKESHFAESHGTDKHCCNRSLLSEFCFQTTPLASSMPGFALIPEVLIQQVFFPETDQYFFPCLKFPNYLFSAHSSTEYLFRLLLYSFRIWFGFVYLLIAITIEDIRCSRMINRFNSLWHYTIISCYYKHNNIRRLSASSSLP